MLRVNSSRVLGVGVGLLAWAWAWAWADWVGGEAHLERSSISVSGEAITGYYVAHVKAALAKEISSGSGGMILPLPIPSPLPLCASAPWEASVPVP